MFNYKLFLVSPNSEGISVIVKIDKYFHSNLRVGNSKFSYMKSDITNYTVNNIILNMNDEIIVFGEEENLIGIYSAPQVTSADIAVILLNAGIIHRVGPNQIYSNLSKHLVSVNIPTFRFDFSGIGDSAVGKITNNQDEYDKSVSNAIEYLESNKGISKFILIGICMGADISLKTALKSEKVAGICFINGEYENIKGMQELLYPVVERKIIIRYNLKNLFNIKRWIRIVRKNRSNLNFKSIAIVGRLFLNIIKTKLRIKENIPSAIKHDLSISDLSNTVVEGWQKIIDRNINIYYICSEGSISLDLYKVLLKKKINQRMRSIMNIDIIKDVDHTFTLVWAQHLLIKKITKWILNNNF